MKLALLWRKLGNSVVYYPKLAKVTGGVTAAVFFCQLVQWQAQLNNTDEWVRISLDEIEEETGLSRVEQQYARSQLVKRSLIQERAIDNSNVLELLPNIDAFETILEVLCQQDYKNPYQATNGKSDRVSVEVETIKTDKFFPVQRQPISVKVNPNYQFSGPWNSQAQFEQFQRALLEYFKEKGFDNPAGCVFKIIDSMTKGLVSPFWDEFIAGIPLGESQKVKRDWEIEPGIAYPVFEEERIQYYVHKGEPLEVAVAKARSDLRDTVLGKNLWEGFLRKCDRIADEAIKAKNLGLKNPYLPPAFTNTNKSPITKESVMNKLTAVVPDFSLSSSIDEALPEANLEPQKQDVDCEIPSLASLQSTYKTPMGKTFVERQLAQHPEWGYGIVDGEVVDLMPF
ncbi:MAG TPA: hypothetical protein DCY88_10995 [Cyanobacteria bacterium UBA11372]|nr:hypothetical protein [Cyanobacteria bacterium UBA11372]